MGCGAGRLVQTTKAASAAFVELRETSCFSAIPGSTVPSERNALVCTEGPLETTLVEVGQQSQDAEAAPATHTEPCTSAFPSASATSLPADPVALSRVDYSSVQTVVDALNEGHTVFIHADWIVKQWQAGGRLLRRQEIEQEAPAAILREVSAADVWDMVAGVKGALNLTEPGKYLLIAVSYPWLAPEHPDPSGAHLSLLGPLLEKFQDELQPFGKQIAVFLDYCSLYQKKRRDHETEWTDAQKQLFSQGLQRVNIWYAHEAVQVWAVTSNAPTHFVQYHDRGWCTFEWHVSLLVSRMVFDICMVPMDSSLLDDLSEDGRDRVSLGALDWASARSGAPTLPSNFNEAIEEKTFTCRHEDLAFVQEKYENVFHDVLAGAKRLCYDDCQLDEGEVDRLVTKVLPLCYNLQELLVGNNLGVTDDALQSLAENCGRLRSLSLAGCSRVTDLGVSYVANRCSGLKKLVLEGCSRVSDVSVAKVADGCRSLQDLWLTGCAVTDASVSLLASKCTDLHKLFLDGAVHVTDASVLQLAERCNRLQVLCLSGCSVTDASVLQLAANCTGLLSLWLAGCARVTDTSVLQLVTKCASLQLLSLERCSDVSDASVSHLAGGDRLHSLTLDGTNVTDTSISQLADTCPGLRLFSLINCCNITDTSVLRLIAKCTKLRSLWLDGCVGVTDVSILSLAETCTKLQWLSLSGCTSLTDAAVLRLAERCTKLRELCLGGCRVVTETAVFQLVDKCSRLEELNLEGCSVSDAAISQLSTKCMHLQPSSPGGRRLVRIRPDSD